MPLMHTWRYQHSTCPKTTAYDKVYDTIQLPTGYKWNMDFAKDCRMLSWVAWHHLGNFHNGALMVNSSWRQSGGSYPMTRWWALVSPSMPIDWRRRVMWPTSTGIMSTITFL